MLRQAWRWFGPQDPVPLDHIRQAGAHEIVTALHDIPIGDAWSDQAVYERKALIENSAPGLTPLSWTVVESIPVPDDIKRLGGAAKRSIAAWIASLEAVARHGIRIVCYNFMPVVDWARTDLDAPLPTGATALRFDHVRFAAFELFILQRPGAEHDFDEKTRIAAKAAYEAMDQKDIDYLVMVIASALPGSTTEPLTIPAFRDRLAQYRDIDHSRLAANLHEFLVQVAPVAEGLGVTLTLHPDDPPRSLFGLPRVASTADDYAALFSAVPSPANGMCFCTGSLGVRADNDLVAMAERFAPRIAFAHLRATRRADDGLSFHEADHLDGDVDMVAVLGALMRENARRRAAEHIVMRPDHGHRMLDDLAKRVTPGYSAIGRLKGLAELRGIMTVLDQDIRGVRR
ncbi:MAG: mannonate dehydratase [Proteobacteria bacterium ST_bin15]|nr:MAG: mannonate dehydratase [Proteobacteria bacterium ST_bin15]